MGYLAPDVQEAIFNTGHPPGTVNKADAQKMLGLVTIEEVDGQGGTVGTWRLENAFVTNATFGDLAYDSDTELLNVTVQMRYDWARYQSGPAVDAAAG